MREKIRKYFEIFETTMIIIFGGAVGIIIVLWPVFFIGFGVYYRVKSLIVIGCIGTYLIFRKESKEK